MTRASLQYPIVRSLQYRRGWGGEAAAAGAVASSAGAPAVASPLPLATAGKSVAPPHDAVAVAASSASAASAPASSSASIATAGDVFSVLAAYLRGVYSESTTRTIVQHVRNTHANALKDLSLDDMEVLAKSIAAVRGEPPALQQTTAATPAVLAAAAPAPSQPQHSSLLTSMDMQVD